MKLFSKQPIVMLVDDDPLIHKFVNIALTPSCKVISFLSGTAALEALHTCRPDLLLLDVIMPEIDGFETLRRLKEQPEFLYLPVIFLTGQTDLQFEIKALSLGAVDYINKPFAVELLARRLEIHLSYVFSQQMLVEYNQNLQKMVDKKVKIVKELKDAIIFTLADLVEMRDNSMGGHILRTQQYYRLILESLTERKVYWEELETIDPELLIEASQLHDIGKVAIPDAILFKPGPLTAGEYEEMKTHTQIGYHALCRAMELTEDKEFLKYAAEMAISHHEKWNGTGYPNSLVKTKIPLSGRIMAVVDVYDALISVRHYKKSMSHEEAVRILVEGSGRHFDPNLINTFLHVEKLFRQLAYSEST